VLIIVILHFSSILDLVELNTIVLATVVKIAKLYFIQSCEQGRELIVEDSRTRPHSRPVNSTR
jgi:hypothetical protein